MGTLHISDGAGGWIDLLGNEDEQPRNPLDLFDDIPLPERARARLMPQSDGTLRAVCPVCLAEVRKAIVISNGGPILLERSPGAGPGWAVGGTGAFAVPSHRRFVKHVCPTGVIGGAC
jgi:hypothetical protein